MNTNSCRRSSVVERIIGKDAFLTGLAPKNPLYSNSSGALTRRLFGQILPERSINTLPKLGDIWEAAF